MGPIEADFLVTVDRARRGDEAAWARLVGDYEPEVRQAARSLLGPGLRTQVDPADLVQSVHWSLVVGLRQGKYDVARPERLLALALTMLRYKVARHWRRLERQRRGAARAAGAVRGPGGPHPIAGAGHDPAQRVQADDLFEYLCRWLTPTERRLVELRLLGYSTAEAACELGRDPGVLRVVLSRLRQRVRAQGLLTGESDPEGGRRVGRTSSRPSAAAAGAGPRRPRPVSPA